MDVMLDIVVIIAQSKKILFLWDKRNENTYHWI